MYAGMLPLILAAAASCYVPLLYGREMGVTFLTVEAVITLVKYVVAYFLIPVLIVLLLPKYTDDHYSGVRLDTFSALIIGYFALVCIVANCLPVQSSVTDFLPLYAAFIVWQSDVYLHVSPHWYVHYGIFASIIVIFTPWLLGQVFALFV